MALRSRTLLAMAASCGLVFSACQNAPGTNEITEVVVDPLPSWHKGPTTKAITDFVARVTKEGGPDFVPVGDRIATFDNDGTLWVELPAYTKVGFINDRVSALASRHPEWKKKQQFAGVLNHDAKAVAAASEKGALWSCWWRHTAA